MKNYSSHYIKGQWVPAHSADRFAVHDSSTEEAACVPAGDADEAANAVLPLRARPRVLGRDPGRIRAALLDKVSAGLKARSDELALAIAREVGMPLKLARAIQVGGPVWGWANFAKVARGFEERQVGNSLVLREPIGVVSCITPWNFPLNQITSRWRPRWPRAAPWCSSPARSHPSTR
jgi:betaine-aldehyde dehydrogenase